MKLTFKLISSFIYIELEKPITFSKLKLSKMKFRTTTLNNHMFFFDINDLTYHNKYMDGTTTFNYTLSVMISDNKDNVIYVVNSDKEHWDLKITDHTIEYLKIIIRNETGHFDTSITQNNPLFLELEYE